MGLLVLRRVCSKLVIAALLLPVGLVGSTAGASAAPGDVVVIGDQVGFYGTISWATRGEIYPAGPAAGPPVTTVDRVAHTVTLAVRDAGRNASVTLAWPMRPGSWQLMPDATDPEQRARLTREPEPFGRPGDCTFTSGNLVVHRAEAAADGGVAALSLDINAGSCWIPGGPYMGVAVRIGDTDPTRVVSIPRAEPSSFSTGAPAGTVVRHAVTVSNAGGKPWKVDQVGIGSNGGTPTFRVEAGSDTCTGVTLAPGGRCSVAVGATSTTYTALEHVVVTGDGPAMLVVPIRLEGYAPVPAPSGVVMSPGRLATTVTWDAPVQKPYRGYRVYDITGGKRTLVANPDRSLTRVIVPGSGARQLALVAAYGLFAESPDVVLDVPSITSEVVTNDWYGAAIAHATDVPGTPPRPIGSERVDLDPTRRLWVTSRSNITVCAVDTEVCTAVPGTTTSALASQPQDAVWLPDGTVAFIRGTTAATRTLWVVRRDGTGLRQVAAIPDRWELAAAPGGSEVLLHSTLREGNIERVRLSDGATTIVPNTSWLDSFSVSSRGLLVVERRVSMADSAGPRTTTVMNLDGTGSRILALPAGDNRNVTFDPTGKKVAFSVFTSDYASSVWVANADGSSARSISGSTDLWTTGLVWSVNASAAPSASLGGPAYSLRDVTLSVGATDADDPAGSLRRECRLDAATAWTSCSSTLVLKGLAAGKHTAYARVTDPSGRRSAIATRTWTVDASAPTASVNALPLAQIKSPFTLAWTAADAGGSLLSTYEVRARTAAPSTPLGAYQYPASWRGLKVRTLSVSPPAGYQYCLSVRARDVAGNVGPWSAERCTAMTLDDRSLTASVGWTRGTSSSYVFGTYSRAVKSGAQLTRASVQGRRIAVVATKCPTCGSLDVSHGGVSIGRVNLYSSTTATRQVTWLATQAVTRTGTVVLRSTSSKAVIVDGIVIWH